MKRGAFRACLQSEIVGVSRSKAFGATRVSILLRGGSGLTLSGMATTKIAPKIDAP